jgi:hypothetical protein
LNAACGSSRQVLARARHLAEMALRAFDPTQNRLNYEKAVQLLNRISERLASSDLESA